MSRGLLPKSYKEINSTLDTSYLYDVSMALIATIGTRNYNLANEIVNGTILSQVSDGKIPYAANYLTANSLSSEYPNQTMAITAYSLGYYLELNPTLSFSTSVCDITKALRDMLQYLQTERDWLYGDGLIYAGYNSTTHDKSFKTETNLLAFFAFKQAGKVLNDTNYTDASNELKNSIIAKLWSNNRLNYGLTDVGVVIPTNTLEINAYGSMFFSEIGDLPKALVCLTKCEIFNIIDSVIGVNGYTAFMGSPDNVWFEMSYAVAVGYYKANNISKYKQIINELNRYVESDGSFKGSLLKTYTDENIITQKSIGSTAWSIIANLLKGSAFKIRTSISPSSLCPQPFRNTVVSNVFTKNNCAGSTNPSIYNYQIPAGRYISFTDQATADSFASNELNTFGQAYTNLTGSCNPLASFANVYESQTFFRNDCPSGQSGTAVFYEVLAGTYFGTTQAEANQYALDDIAANGQNNANAIGSCNTNTVSNYIYIDTVPNYFDEITATANSSIATNTDITISWELFDGNGVSQGIQNDLTINSGQSTSFLSNTYINNSQPNYYAVITNVTPSSFSGMTYIFL